MASPRTSLDDLLKPIISDWTIRDLLEWLSDDARTHDDALRHPLRVIDAALTGASWQQEPSTIALVRSIAAAVQTAPRLRNMRLDDLLGHPLDVRIAQLGAKPVANRPIARFERETEPQVA